ncbi:unnamed protein product [Caenorhabditis sp. 36 PRJEB53466]|nr:unnamed protein product [Caenorhabditis sp. 36 PRJEB53466]
MSHPTTPAAPDEVALRPGWKQKSEITKILDPRIPKFSSGKSSELKEWLESYSKIVYRTGVPKKLATELIPFYLSGPALHKYNALPESVTKEWETMARGLVEAHNCPADKELALQEFTTLTQGSRTPSEFAEAIRTVGNYAYDDVYSKTRDRLLAAQFVNGSDKKIRSRLRQLQKAPTTLREATAEAEKIQRLLEIEEAEDEDDTMIAALQNMGFQGYPQQPRAQGQFRGNWYPTSPQQDYPSQGTWNRNNFRQSYNQQGNWCWNGPNEGLFVPQEIGTRKDSHCRVVIDFEKEIPDKDHLEDEELVDEQFDDEELEDEEHKVEELDEWHGEEDYDDETTEETVEEYEHEPDSTGAEWERAPRVSRTVRLPSITSILSVARMHMINPTAPNSSQYAQEPESQRDCGNEADQLWWEPTTSWPNLAPRRRRFGGGGM